MLNWTLGLGALGMLFLYDWNGVSLKEQQISHLLIAGNVRLAVVAVHLVWLSQTVRFGGWLLWFTEAAVFLALLIYTSYSALPLDSTYCKEVDLHTMCRSGMYGRCHHPGIWWFFRCFFCLGMPTSLGEWMIFCLILPFLNLLYAWCQGRCILAAEFPDYEDYRRIVPFLIPNSI